MKLFNNKKGQALIYIASFFAILIIIVSAAVLAPAGIEITTALYGVGDDLITETQSGALQTIDDANVKARINETLAGATATTETNIDALTFLYKYGWVLAVLSVVLIAFIIVRRQTEFTSGFT